MFPTLSDVIAYLFHVQIPLPIQTFGLFMALAFVFAYLAFRVEFKRKEADGYILPFTEKQVVGLPASWQEVAVNTLLGALFGYKVLGALVHYETFVLNAPAFIFSAEGSPLLAVIGGFGFGFWIYSDRKSKQLHKPVTVTKTVHPYQLTPYLVFVLAFWGFIGAKLFDLVEHWQSFLNCPLAVLFAQNGFAFYGGLIFGALAYLYIGYKKGMKLIHLADIGSPGMMLAYAVGRLGCHFSGDGDWGIVNIHVKPNWLAWLPDWGWAYRYPNNIIDAGVPIEGCFTAHCMQLANGVYPVPLYESLISFALFGSMWFLRKHLKVPGYMFFLYLILNGTERLFMEQIRIIDRHHFFLTFTQAQFIGSLFILGGVWGVVGVLRRAY